MSEKSNTNSLIQSETVVADSTTEPETIDSTT